MSNKNAVNFLSQYDTLQRSCQIIDEQMFSIFELYRGLSREENSLGGEGGLYSSYKETLEKKNMGFSMNKWDEKLLKYGSLFESKMMDLSVNLSLENSLDLGWEILAECFQKDETGIKSDLTDEFWPVG